MDGEWLQYNSGVHNKFDLFMTSKHNHLFQDNHSDEMDGLLEATTVVGNTDDANIVATDHNNNDGETHNEKLQKDLSERLGMSAQQVKFWFQNKSTFSKGKMQRWETQNRWVENERLKTERQAIMLAMQNKTCLKCRGVMVQTQDTSERQRLYTENMRLKEELLHATAYLKEGLRRNGMSLPWARKLTLPSLILANVNSSA
ncbi:homeobox-leucine zipper protein HDG1-like [Triticum aestivum]|nr:homeobox-leucine zipper protein HDG1-like [Triticum aestivum]